MQAAKEGLKIINEIMNENNKILITLLGISRLFSSKSLPLKFPS